MPGSAHVITRSDLDRQASTDLHRALAGVPGVSVQEEEGFGLRPNISLRGTDPERSRNITALEDGVLIAPAPYSAPSIHILPPIGRLHGIEILKGSSQIKYGPRTQGGLLNLLTTPIPPKFQGYLDVSSGPNNQGKVHAHAGDSRVYGGYLVEVFQDGRDGFQKLPDAAPTGYNLRDYTAKVRFNTHPDRPTYQEIEFKATHNTQTSYSSYLGLTEADFNEDPYSRYAASRNDRWDSERDIVQARYAYRPLAWLDVNATAYHQTLERNWYKLAAAAGTPIAVILRQPGSYARAYAALRGLGTKADTLQIEGNKRDFEASGIQGSVVARRTWAGLAQEAELGLRYHQDSEDRREYTDHWIGDAGRLEMVRAGLAGDKSNRLAEADAWAVHFQDRIQWRTFGLVPGIRYERIGLVRSNWGKDLDRADAAKIDQGEVDAMAWGLGGTWQAAPPINLFAGIHKGISPPVPGNSDSADTEASLNYELGLRSTRGQASLEVTAFLTDYQNLLGTELAITGGPSSERQYNGGGVLVKGIESAIGWDAGKRFSLGMEIPLRLAYTYTETEFRSSFVSPLEQWLTVERGDELPYIPRHQISAGAGMRYKILSVDVMGKYLGKMRTVAGKGAIPHTESAGDYSYIDAAVEVALFNRARIYAAGRNLFDEVGLAARNPAGLRPNMPRSLLAGIKSGF